MSIDRIVKEVVYRFAGIDESGNLSLSKLASKYFILSCFLHNDESFDKKFRKFIGKLNHKKSKKKVNTLHARNDNDTVKIKTLKFLKNFEFKVVVYVTKKDKSKTPDLDYHGMLGRLVFNMDAEQIKVSSPRANEDFRKKILEIDDRISLSNPQDCPALQIADLFAWAVFKKLEHNDDMYFKFMQDRIELVEIKI